MIQKFLKTVEEEDLFPGEIRFYKGILASNLIVSKQFKKLNARKKDKTFFDRVLRKRQEKPLKTKLLALIAVMKEKGLENDKDQMTINEAALKDICGLSKGDYAKALQFGIEKSCVKKQNIKGKVRITLISEDIVDDEDENDVDNNAVEKRNGKKVFRTINLHGFENENEKMICSEDLVRKEVKLDDEVYEKALEYCEVHGCVRRYNGKKKTYILLLKEDFPEKGSGNMEELKKKVIKVVKTSKTESEEGYLFMAEEKLLKVLKLSKSKLKQVVQYGLKEELLKFDEIKKVKVVVYTHERRLSINKLI